MAVLDGYLDSLFSRDLINFGNFTGRGNRFFDKTTAARTKTDPNKLVNVTILFNITFLLEYLNIQSLNLH